MAASVVRLLQAQTTVSRSRTLKSSLSWQYPNCRLSQANAQNEPHATATQSHGRSGASAPSCCARDAGSSGRYSPTLEAATSPQRRSSSHRIPNQCPAHGSEPERDERLRSCVPQSRVPNDFTMAATFVSSAEKYGSSPYPRSAAETPSDSRQCEPQPRPRPGRTPDQAPGAGLRTTGAPPILRLPLEAEKRPAESLLIQGDASEVLKHVSGTHVTSMNDQLGIPQCFNSFRANNSVRVRNHTDVDCCLSHRLW